MARNDGTLIQRASATVEADATESRQDGDSDRNDDAMVIEVAGVQPPEGSQLGREVARIIALGVFAGGRALVEHHRRERETAPPSTTKAPAREPDATEREVMTVDEAAAFLGLDRNTVYDACGRSQIPHRRVGKRILLSRSQLVAWLGACKAAPVGNG